MTRFSHIMCEDVQPSGSGIPRQMIAGNPETFLTVRTRQNPSYEMLVYLLQLGGARVVTSLDRCPSIRSGRSSI
jgi:hypothetical protein